MVLWLWARSKGSSTSRRAKEPTTMLRVTRPKLSNILHGSPSKFRSQVHWMLEQRVDHVFNCRYSSPACLDGSNADEIMRVIAPVTTRLEGPTSPKRVVSHPMASATCSFLQRDFCLTVSRLPKSPLTDPSSSNPSVAAEVNAGQALQTSIFSRGYMSSRKQ